MFRGLQEKCRVAILTSKFRVWEATRVYMYKEGITEVL